MDENFWSIGEIAYLNSGSEAMTIVAFAEDADGEEFAVCQWFDADGELCEETFPADALVDDESAEEIED